MFFDKFEPFKRTNYICEQRNTIDTVIKITNELKIIYNEVFPETDWKIICDCQSGDDVYHLSKYAYEKLGSFLTNIILTNSNQ